MGECQLLVPVQRSKTVYLCRVDFCLRIARRSSFLKTAMKYDTVKYPRFEIVTRRYSLYFYGVLAGQYLK